MQKHLIIALKSFYISNDFKQKRHDRNIRDWQNKKSIIAVLNL